MENKHIALRCWSSNENHNADFDYALVILTPELLALIEKRRALFVAMHEADRQLSSIRFCDCAPVYFSEADLSGWLDGIGNRDMDGAELLIDGGEVEELPASFDPEAIHGEDTRSFRSECDHMTVGDYGVRWTCIPKHSSIEIETAELSYKDIAEMIRAEMQVVQE